MFGLQTLLASSVVSTLIYALIGIAIIGVAYFFYNRYQQQQREQNQHRGFSPLRKERRKRTAAVQNHTANSLHLQENAGHILQGIQQQQTHLGALIGEFETALKNVQDIDVELGQTNHNLRDRIISPIEELIKKMQAQYQRMHEQLVQLSAAFSETNRTIIQREQEISHIVHNLSSIESSAYTGVSQLQIGLASIADIRKSMNRKTQEIKELKDKNSVLNRNLRDLTEKTQKLVEIRELQQQRIDELEACNAENLDPIHSNRRTTLSPSFKLFNPTEPPEGYTSKNNTQYRRTNGLGKFE